MFFSDDLLVEGDKDHQPAARAAVHAGDYWHEDNPAAWNGEGGMGEKPVRGCLFSPFLMLIFLPMCSQYHTGIHTC